MAFFGLLALLVGALVVYAAVQNLSVGALLRGKVTKNA